MWKKHLLLSLALLLTCTANCTLCCRLSLAGEPVKGLYSPRSVAMGAAAAERAAEEITRGCPDVPQFARRYCLSLSPPSADAASLSDRLLRATAGVAAGCAVDRDGGRLGYVENRAILLEQLHARIYGGDSRTAAALRLDGTLSLTSVYTRREWLSGYGEMLERLEGIVPAAACPGGTDHAA